MNYKLCLRQVGVASQRLLCSGAFGSGGYGVLRTFVGAFALLMRGWRLIVKGILIRCQFNFVVFIGFARFARIFMEKVP